MFDLPTFAMSRLPFPALRFAVAILFLGVFHPPLRATQDPATAASTPAASPPPTASLGSASGKPEFYSTRTVLWTGRTAVIPLRTTPAADGDQTFTLNVSEPGVLEDRKSVV